MKGAPRSMLASLPPSGTADACSIAIVGGGASGALMTAHLLKCAGDGVRVTLIEPRAQIGRGLAYATENESHRLNVRASNMSAFPDDPDHFWNWLRANGHRGEDRFCFLPRSVYGRYLGGLVEDRLAETDPRRVRWLYDFVTGLSERGGSVTLRFSRSEPAVFDMAVLCCGHEASETLDAPFVSPWEDPCAWNGAPEFNDPDSGHRIDDGRCRDCAERVRPSRTHCRPFSARSSPASPSPRRAAPNHRNGIAFACEARFFSALASRESARRNAKRRRLAKRR